MNWIGVYLLIIKIQALGLLGNWSKREFGKGRETNPHNKLLSGKGNAGIGKKFGITIQAVTNTIKCIDKTREENERFYRQIVALKKSLEVK